MAVLDEILRTLKDMNSRSRSNPSPGNVFEGSLAAGFAQRAISGAMGSAPLVSGTLAGHADLLMGAIGSDKATIDQVVRLTSIVQGLENAWKGVNQETRSMIVNSAAGIAGMAAIANVGMGAIRGVAGGVQSLRQAPGNMYERLNDLYEQWGGTGPRAGARSAMQTRRALAFGMGEGIAGTGMAMNAMFGESYAGDALAVGGSAISAYQGARYLASSEFMRGANPWLRGGTRIAGGALLAAQVYASLPRGHAAEHDASDGDPVATRYKRSLGYSNEYPTILAGADRAVRSAIRGDSAAYAQAMITSGIVPGQTDSMAFRSGGIWGYIKNRALTMYGATRHLDEEEMDMVSRNMSKPGSVTPKQHELERVTAALNFQSRQMDIGDLHASLQQEVVRTDMEQRRVQQLIDSLDRLQQTVNTNNNINSGGGPSPSPPVPPT